MAGSKSKKVGGKTGAVRASKRVSAEKGPKPISGMNLRELGELRASTEFQELSSVEAERVMDMLDRAGPVASPAQAKSTDVEVVSLAGEKRQRPETAAGGEAGQSSQPSRRGRSEVVVGRGVQEDSSEAAGVASGSALAENVDEQVNFMFSSHFEERVREAPFVVEEAAAKRAAAQRAAAQVVQRVGDSSQRTDVVMPTAQSNGGDGGAVGRGISHNIVFSNDGVGSQFRSVGPMNQVDLTQPNAQLHGEPAGNFGYQNTRFSNSGSGSEHRGNSSMGNAGAAGGSVREGSHYVPDNQNPQYGQQRFDGGGLEFRVDRGVREADVVGSGNARSMDNGKSGVHQECFWDKDGRKLFLVGVTKPAAAVGAVSGQLAIYRLCDDKRMVRIVDAGNSTILDVNGFRKWMGRQAQDDGPENAFWLGEVVPWALVPHFSILFEDELKFAAFMKMEFDVLEKCHFGLMDLVGGGKVEEDITLRDVTVALGELQRLWAMLFSKEAAAVLQGVIDRVAILRDVTVSGAYVFEAITKSLIKAVGVLREPHVVGTVLASKLNNASGVREALFVVRDLGDLRNTAWCWALFGALVAGNVDLSVEKALIHGHIVQRAAERRRREMEARAGNWRESGSLEVKGVIGDARPTIKYAGSGGGGGKPGTTAVGEKPCVARCVHRAFPHLGVDCVSTDCMFNHSSSVVEAVVEDVDRFERLVNVIKFGIVFDNRIGILEGLKELNK